jgi:NADH:ubiquinone oxidoreductase subunit 6 (subunit J)
MSNVTRTIFAGAGGVAVAASPAIAHPGDHHAMGFAELAAHLTSGWHLAVLIAAGVIVAALVVAIRHNRRVRAHAAPHRRREP